MRASRWPVFANDETVDRTLKHSIKDGIYFSAMTGGAESYFSAFAIHLQASTTLVGLLASLPPLLASSMQVLSAWLGRRLRRRRELIVTGALFQAACFIPIALVPLVLPQHAAWLLLPLVFLYFCGPNLGAPQWNSLVGDLLPEARRGRFFALRTRLSSVASLSALIVAGLVLDVADRYQNAYWGFVVIFMLGAGMRCLSTYHLNAMQEPSSRVAALEIPDDLTLWRRLRHSRLLRFSLFFAAMQFAVAISGPYFTLYMLRDLALSYLEFMIITTMSVLVQFLTLNRWGRLSDLFGNRLLLLTTGTIITIIPSLWLVSTNFFWLLAVQALSGLGWAGFTLSATGSVFDLTPAEHRATLFAAHNVLAAVAVFLGAGTGAVLAPLIPDQLSLLGREIHVMTPLHGLFFFSSLTRLMVALSFLPLLREVRRVRPMSMTGLIFRVTRMHPVSGLIYDIVGRFRRGTDPVSGNRKADGQNHGGSQTTNTE
jgi:MFS family permease